MTEEFIVENIAPSISAWLKKNDTTRDGFLKELETENILKMPLTNIKTKKNIGQLVLELIPLTKENGVRGSMKIEDLEGKTFPPFYTTDLYVAKGNPFKTASLRCSNELDSAYESMSRSNKQYRLPCNEDSPNEEILKTLNDRLKEQGKALRNGK